MSYVQNMVQNEPDSPVNEASVSNKDSSDAEVTSEKQSGNENSMSGLNRRKFAQTAGIFGSGILLPTQATSASIPTFESDEPTIEHLPADILMITTGGTIASTQSPGDGQTGEQLIEEIPEIQAYANIDIEQVAFTGSSSLTPDQYADVAEAAEVADNEGYDGVIVTHGTDAIEEDAFYNDLVLDIDIPVIFVGAMRQADAISADGPANLINALRAAARPELSHSDRPSGVYVMLNNTLHAARDVTKSHTTQPDTFDSLYAGPVGTFAEEFRMYRMPGSYSPDLSSLHRSNKKVEIVTSGAGVESTTIQQALDESVEIDGIVIDSVGRGNMASELEEQKEAALEAEIPIVTTSQNFNGQIEGRTIPAGNLPAPKARLLLMLALEETSKISELRSIFRDAKYSRGGLPPSAVSVEDDGTVSVNSEDFIPIEGDDIN